MGGVSRNHGESIARITAKLSKYYCGITAGRQYFGRSGAVRVAGAAGLVGGRRLGAHARAARDRRRLRSRTLGARGDLILILMSMWSQNLAPHEERPSLADFMSSKVTVPVAWPWIHVSVGIGFCP